MQDLVHEHERIDDLQVNNLNNTRSGGILFWYRRCLTGQFC